MTECEICKTEINKNLAICNVCKYPLQGTDREQAVYVANYVTQKSDIAESIEKIKKSRMILFALGAFYIIAPFTPIMNTPSSVSLIISIVLGLIFVGFGFLTFKKPKIALFIPLTIIVLYYILLLIINPLYLFSGILWKLIVLIGLGYAYLSVRKSSKILKENEYIASLFTDGEMKNK